MFLSPICPVGGGAFLSLLWKLFFSPFLLKHNETYEDNYNFYDDAEGKGDHFYDCNLNYSFQEVQYSLFCGSCPFFVKNRFSNLSFFLKKNTVTSHLLLRKS